MAITSILSRDAHAHIASTDYWADDDWDTNVTGANAAYQGDADALSTLTDGADEAVATLLDIDPEQVMLDYVHVTGEKSWIDGRYPVSIGFDIEDPPTLPDRLSYRVHFDGETEEIQEMDVEDRAYAAPRNHRVSVRRGIPLTAGEFGEFVGCIAPEADRTQYSGTTGTKTIYASETGDIQ